ncbi:MAG: formate/nitrite transporter family protein [Actinomycetota bacterium]
MGHEPTPTTGNESADQEDGGAGDETEAATKPAPTILRQEIMVGTEQLGRTAPGLFLSAVSAGLDIGFGPLLVVAVLGATPDDTLATRLATAVVYSIGFVIVILGRSELFTEHTTLAVLPLLSGDASVRQVARLWALVYAGNLLGVAVFASLAAPLGTGLGLFDASHVDRMTDTLLEGGWLLIAGGGIAAGWLMGLVSWLVTAARDTIGQIVIIVLVTGSIAFLGLHHSIAGSVEVLIGVLSAGTSLGEWARFLVGATIGNAIGGIVLVAALKYGHIVQLRPHAQRQGSN